MQFYPGLSCISGVSPSVRHRSPLPWEALDRLSFQRTTHVSNVGLFAPTFSHYSVLSRGEACDAGGPLRGVLNETLRLLIDPESEESLVWDIARRQPHLYPTVPESQQRAARVFGVVVALFLVWLETLPELVSPCFAIAAARGPESLLNGLLLERFNLDGDNLRRLCKLIPSTITGKLDWVDEAGVVLDNQYYFWISQLLNVDNSARPFARIFVLLLI